MELQFLDCTLRDGGYYNNWDFDNEFVKNYFENISNLPFNYVEIGYQNPPHSGSNTPFPRIYITDKFVKISKTEYNAFLKQGLFHYKFKTSDRLMDAACIIKFGDKNSRVEFLTK